MSETKTGNLVIEGDATELFKAIVRAQAEFPDIHKPDSGQKGNTKFRYAGYATIIKTLRPALCKHGIAVLQALHSEHDKDGGEWAVTTTILAGHGATIRSSLWFRHDDDPQEFGRCHTYHRRYQLQSMLAVEGDDDADAPKPSETKEATQFSEPAPKAKPTPAAAERSTPKVNGAAGGKSTNAAVNAEPKGGNGSTSQVVPKEPASQPVAAKPAQDAVTGGDVAAVSKRINVLLQEALQQLNWDMAQMKAFYIEHVDKAGYEKASNLSIEQKRALHDKLVELHDVIPF